MKRRIKIFIWVVVVLLVGWISYMAFQFVAVMSFFLFGDGIDHYAYLDESERYEFLMLNDLVLMDEVQNIGIAGCIQEYIKKDPYIYIVDGSCFSTGGTADGVIYYYDNDPNTGERIAYTDLAKIPLYMVLNYETGEAVQYMSLDEMPEEIRLIFEEPITEECLYDRTCYKTDTNSETQS